MFRVKLTRNAHSAEVIGLRSRTQIRPSRHVITERSETPEQF